MAVAFEDDRASYRQARSHFAAAAANRLKPKADEGCETWKGLTEPPSKSRELQRHGGGWAAQGLGWCPLRQGVTGATPAPLASLTRRG